MLGTVVRVRLEAKPAPKNTPKSNSKNGLRKEVAQSPPHIPMEENKDNWSLEDTLEKIDLYADVAYSKEPIPGQSKVFYYPHDWSGWRFYLKALKHNDWRSIKSHILTKFSE